jgi:hypothetical protein
VCGWLRSSRRLVTWGVCPACLRGPQTAHQYRHTYRQAERHADATTADPPPVHDVITQCVHDTMRAGIPCVQVHQYERMLQDLPDEPSIHVLLARSLMAMDSLVRARTGPPRTRAGGGG